MMKPALCLTGITLLIFMLSHCSRDVPIANQSVVHGFSDAKNIDYVGALTYPEEGQPLRSKLTYPLQDAVWAVQWQGKQALRFESAELGERRGSLYSFHEPLKRNFQIHLNTWLDLENPDTWTGLVGWMGTTNKHAVGVRWKASLSTHTLTLQAFKYDFPHVNPLAARSYPLQRSQWIEVQLEVNKDQLSCRMGEFDSLAVPLDTRWYIGDYWGLYQGLGTGYFADVQVGTNAIHTDLKSLIEQWNSEMVNTTRKVLLEKFSTPDDFAGQEIPVRRVSLADEWRTVIPVQCPSRITYRMKIPPKSTLHTSFGILPPFALSNTQAEFTVAIRAGSREETLFSQPIHPAKEPVNSFRYHDVHVSLDRFAGQEVELIQKMEPIQGDQPLLACWSEPVIAVAQTAPRKPNVLLIILDTLRADRVGVYGNQRHLTPYIDHLAKRGAVFLNTIAQAPWTTPSHASFFTGLYPSETGCDHSGNQGNRLHEAYITWAERMQKSGYVTAAFTNGLQVRGEIGFNQGFDLYQDIMYDSSYSLEAIYDRTQEWWDHHQQEPWFLFLHTYAVHFPYNHQQYVDYRNVPRSWNDQMQIDRDTYDSGVRYADEWVGSILRELQRRHLFDQTLIIITSDHGEDLGERGMPRPARHGHTLYDEVLKVPLVFHLPGRIQKGRRFGKQVRLTDVLPTVLDLLDLEEPAVSRGHSLVPVMHQREQKKRFAFSEAMTYGIAQKSIRTESHKMIYLVTPTVSLDDTPTGFPVPVPQPVYLFNLLNDKQETVNVASTEADKLRELRSIQQYIESQLLPPSFFTSGSEMQTPPPIPPRVMEQMQNMGYVK